MSNTGKVPMPSELRRRVFEARHPLAERSRIVLPPQGLDVIDAEFDDDTLAPAVERNVQQRLRALEAEVATLRGRVQAQPAVDALQTVTVMLVGFTVDDTVRIDRGYRRKRCSKSWSVQLRPGDKHHFYELLFETVEAGAWLIVQGPGLLSDVTVATHLCEIPTITAGPEHRARRVLIDCPIRVQERFTFNLELAP